jgi:hypothetical protein
MEYLPLDWLLSRPNYFGLSTQGYYTEPVQYSNPGKLTYAEF